MTDTVSAPVPSPSSAPIVSAPIVSAPIVPAPDPVVRTRALSVVSIVLSGVALLLGQGILGVGGIVLGFIARRDEPTHRTLSTWGIVLGFVAVFGWVVLVLAGAAVLVPLWLAGALHH